MHIFINTINSVFRWDCMMEVHHEPIIVAGCNLCYVILYCVTPSLSPNEGSQLETGLVIIKLGCPVSAALPISQLCTSKILCNRMDAHPKVCMHAFWVYFCCVGIAIDLILCVCVCLLPCF